MKKVLAYLIGLARGLIARWTHPVHNDALRANQGDRGPGFSFWRALVS